MYDLISNQNDAQNKQLDYSIDNICKDLEFENDQYCENFKPH